jgi:GxxExxY protein
MPIHTSIPITVFDQEAFHAVDKVVTGMAFDIHNEFGGYLDERLYQRELGSRLSVRGLDVHREMQMTLTLDDFSRDYFADFLVNHGVIVETKAVAALTNAHKAQTLNYPGELKCNEYRSSSSPLCGLCCPAFSRSHRQVGRRTRGWSCRPCWNCSTVAR